MHSTQPRECAPRHDGVADSVAASVEAVHHRIDELAACSSGAADAELVPHLGEVRRAIARLQAVELGMVSAAQRSRVAAKSGHTDTGAWLAHTLRTTGRDAAGTVRLADAIERRLPATRDALAGGVVSREHAAVIDHALRELPTALSSDLVRLVEASLVEKATTMDPAALRKEGRRALARVESEHAVVNAHEDGLLRSEEDRAWDKTRLTLHDNHDGTTTGHFTIPTLAGAILTKVLHSMASPRRHGFHGRPSVDPAQTTPRIRTVEPVETTRQRGWDQRLGQAFVEILEHLPTDRLHGKAAATVIITLAHDQLLGRLQAAELDTGDLVSSAAARRMACQAGLLPAVLGRKSQLLDMGHTARFFTDTQRTALATRHSTCAADGCARPYAWCELHHRRPWSEGGTTNLNDAIPLCGHHHRLVHHPDYNHSEHERLDRPTTLTFRQRC